MPQNQNANANANANANPHPNPNAPANANPNPNNLHPHNPENDHLNGHHNAQQQGVQQSANPFVAILLFLLWTIGVIFFAVIFAVVILLLFIFAILVSLVYNNLKLSLFLPFTRNFFHNAPQVHPVQNLPNPHNDWPEIMKQTKEINYSIFIENLCQDCPFIILIIVNNAVLSTGYDFFSLFSILTSAFFVLLNVYSNCSSFFMISYYLHNNEHVPLGFLDLPNFLFYCPSLIQNYGDLIQNWNPNPDEYNQAHH